MLVLTGWATKLFLEVMDEQSDLLLERKLLLLNWAISP